MALLAVELETKLYEAIAGAVFRGNYTSPQHFLEVAAWNQLALEEASGRDVGHGPAGRGDDRGGGAPSRRDEAWTRARGPSREHPSLTRARAWQPMVRKVELAGVFPPTEPLNEPNRALWGQTNRVLPIAAGVRVLAHLVSQRDGAVTAGEWHRQATRVAIELREELHRRDEESRRLHGKRWATAFPSDEPPSAHRYVNQFLGMPRESGLPEGGAAFLGFVTFDGTGEDAQVSLTRSGAEWASFENPIFDDDDGAQSTFSIEEARFFLEHLRRFRSGEFGFLNAVAALVAGGRSRSELDDDLAHQYPNWKKFISTMRAGALGRLSDLGLLDRSRRGLEVDYHLSPRAAELGLPDDAFGRR